MRRSQVRFLSAPPAQFARQDSLALPSWTVPVFPHPRCGAWRQKARSCCYFGESAYRQLHFSQNTTQSARPLRHRLLRDHYCIARANGLAAGMRFGTLQSLAASEGRVAEWFNAPDSKLTHALFPSPHESSRVVFARSYVETPHPESSRICLKMGNQYQICSIRF